VVRAQRCAAIATFGVLEKRVRWGTSVRFSPGLAPAPEVLIPHVTLRGLRPAWDVWLLSRRPDDLQSLIWSGSTGGSSCPLVSPPSRRFRANLVGAIGYPLCRPVRVLGTYATTPTWSSRPLPKFFLFLVVATLTK